MRIDINIRDLDSTGGLVEYATRRVHAHLSRFAPELTSVVVRLRDVNGPKGGLDKRCRIVVRGPRVGSIALDSLMDNPRAAVDSCVERAAYTVGRSLERSRELSVRYGSLRRAS